DANPMNRRLPAEVVTRKRQVPRGEKAEAEKDKAEEVQVDLKAVLALKPEARPKWLAKACKAVEDGKASATELYNIVSSRKFAAGLPADKRTGRKLVGILKENLELFSDKQRRYLKSKDCPIIANFAENDSDDEAPDAASRTEEMMARCRSFVRENASTFE
ncbi:unnamed protein product, partial [Polarella glacialis]